MHTTASRGTRIKYDSVITPREAINVLALRGIDAVVVTDHNTTSSFELMRYFGLKRGILVIRGIEISTLDGHVIGIGVSEGIDDEVRRKISELTVEEAVDMIKDFGGEVYIPHPFDVQRKGIGRRIFDIEGIVEVFNPMNIFRFENDLANAVATFLKRPKAVGSDAHTPEFLDVCVTKLSSSLDEESIIYNLKKGKVTFENCRYMTLKEIKNWIMRRMILSYDDIKGKIREGWPEDCWYMKLANNKIMRKLETLTLDFGIRNPESRIWDLVSFISYSFTSLYAYRVKKYYCELISKHDSSKNYLCIM